MTNLYTDHDPACCAVLEARVADGSLPAGDVRRADVRDLDAAALAPYSHVHLFCGMGGSPLGLAWAGWPPTWSVVTGGFPCQDISSAGKGAGLDGARSGLFWELCRVIDIKKPLGVFAENVGALSARGLDRVAGALESLGYWVEALRVGAWAVGSPQERERWWFVCRRADGDGGRWPVAGDHGDGRETRRGYAPDEYEGTASERHIPPSDPRSGVAEPGGRGRREREPGRGPEARAAAVGAGSGGSVDDRPGVGERGLSAGQRRPDQATGDSDRAGEGGELADLRDGRYGADGRHRAQGADADQPGAGGQLAVGDGVGRQAIAGDAPGATGRRASDDAGSCPARRWPHPRWCVIDADGRERTVPTPQHGWEPPRAFAGSKTISARWRLALMGYPLHWLDVPDETIAALAPKYKTPARRAAWWNKQGVAMTGNAQVPQNVELLARAAIEAGRAA